MTIVRTDFGITRERARELRFEKVAGIPATDVQEAIEDVYAAAIAPPSINPTSVNFAMSPYTVLGTDTVLYVDSTAGAVNILLQAGAARTTALIVKDVGGAALTNNITLTPNGVETIDAMANVAINAAYSGYELYPRPAGYTLAP